MTLRFLAGETEQVVTASSRTGEGAGGRPVGSAGTQGPRFGRHEISGAGGTSGAGDRGKSQPSEPHKDETIQAQSKKGKGLLLEEA